MGHVLQVLRLGYPTGLPEDVAEWTFSWETSGPPDSTHAAAAHLILAEALNVVGTAGHSLGSYISEYVDRARCDALYFDVDTATGDMSALLPLPLPIDVDAAIVGVPLPLEVALCMSFENVVDDVPARNRRGRVYIGPLQDAMTEDAGHLPHPNNNLLNAVFDFGTSLLDQSIASADPHVTWSVWSRVNAALHNVAGGWVDNEWDTQRRRGARATDRAFFTATP